MMLVDTHTHLYLEQFDNDRSEIVDSAIEKGIEYMLLPNIDTESLEAMKSLSRLYPQNCLPMMGMHPTSVKEDYELELTVVEHELKSGNYIAVGEIGIDLYWDQIFKDQQEDALRRQLKLAKRYKLPVSLHSRNSFEQIYKIVKEELTDDLQGVFHCFTGTPEEARMITDVGFKMGIGGIVTFKNAGLAEVVKDIDLEHLMLETDAPFLSPAPFRGKRNQSAYLVYIAEKIAEIKGLTTIEIAEYTTRNAIDLFNLSSK